MTVKFLATLGLASAILLAQTSSVAEIYKVINPDGSVTFSDQPSEGASAVPETAKPSIITPTPSPAAKQTTTQESPPTPAEKQTVTYKTLTIASPKNDEAVRSNEGIVTVTLALVPLLDPEQGDNFTLFLDGKAVAQPGNLTAFTLNGVTRGTHTLSATLKNRDGTTLLTAPTIKFHLLKAQARN